MKKNKLPLWLCGGLLFLLSSCLGNNDVNVDEWNLSNCQISTFSLSCDSIPNLSSVKFTIDQVNGLIFNRDSLPYGTNINFKVICSLTFSAGSVASIDVHQKAIDKKDYWKGDSLDFRDEVVFSIISKDENSSKIYTAKLNVHQQNPNVMEWTRLAEPFPVNGAADRKVILRGETYLMYVKNATNYELYQASVSNVNTWTKTPLSGLPNKTFLLSQITEYEDNLYLLSTDGVLCRSVDGANWTVVEGTSEIVVLLGVIEAATTVQPRSSAMAAVVKEGNTWRFASMDASGQWQKGSETPSNFPISGFASNSYSVMYYNHLVVVAGNDRNGALSNKSWDTMDGLSWICLTGNEITPFSQREGVMLTNYDGKLYLIGGIDASNQGLKDIYISADKGITWALADSLTFLPEEYQGRGYASVLVDKDKFVLLFGGKERNESNMLNELWYGRINRLGHKD